MLNKNSFSKHNTQIQDTRLEELVENKNTQIQQLHLLINKLERDLHGSQQSKTFLQESPPSKSFTKPDTLKGYRFVR